MSLAPYPDPDDRDAELATVCEAIGAELVPYGESVQGRPLLAASFGEPGRPVAFVGANIHGVEFIGNRVAVAFLRSLPGSRLAERARVWVAPCINPDGYARTWERGGMGRVGELRCNANGVDLNRNFPMPWRARPSRWPGTGSLQKGAATYRGEAPLSEPETRHLAALLARIEAHAAANLHSFMGTVIPPRCLHAEDRSAYARLAAAFADGQERSRYRRLSSAVFDVFTGEQEDYQHHVLCTWAVCVEVFPIPASFRQHLWSPSLFWRFNPRDPAPYVASDVPGLHALLHAGLDLERPPCREGASACLPGWTG